MSWYVISRSLEEDNSKDFHILCVTHSIHPSIHSPNQPKPKWPFLGFYHFNELVLFSSLSVKTPSSNSFSQCIFRLRELWEANFALSILDKRRKVKNSLLSLRIRISTNPTTSDQVMNENEITKYEFAKREKCVLISNQHTILAIGTTGYKSHCRKSCERVL